MWVFRLIYQNTNCDTEYSALHYARRQTLEIIHSEELTHHQTAIVNNYFNPHFLPFRNVEIESKSAEIFKDFVLHITTLIVPFTLREVSLHFLL